jgi:hypothetical protein
MRKQLALASLAVLAAATATPARADVVIGPRVSYYFDNSNLRTSTRAMRSTRRISRCCAPLSASNRS